MVCTWLISRHGPQWAEPTWRTEERDRGLGPRRAVGPRVAGFAVVFRLSPHLPLESAYQANGQAREVTTCTNIQDNIALHCMGLRDGHTDSLD